MQYSEGFDTEPPQPRDKAFPNPSVENNRHNLSKGGAATTG
jgi:hypothetical protein